MKKLFIKSFNTDFIQNTLLSVRNRLPRIVYYHLVSDSADIPYYYKNDLFSPKVLDEQLKWYKNKGYTFISLDEAVYLAENNEKATKTIAFTTDDGFKENYTTIAPVFQKYNAQSTLFLVSDCLDNNDLIWNNKVYLIQRNITREKEKEICYEIEKKYRLGKNIVSISLLCNYWPMNLKTEIADFAWDLARLPPLKAYLQETKPYMTNEQIKELLSAGYSIGSHSKSHPDFTKLPESEIRHEMQESKQILADTFKTTVHYYAYPYGKRPKDKTIETRILKEKTYKILFGTKSNLSNNRNNKVWERDKMEQENEKAQFWFSTVPLLRYALLHPLRIYK